MSKLNWEKFEGEHPAMQCNWCGSKFKVGGWCHERPVKKAEPGLGTMSLVVCKVSCKWRIEGNPARVNRYFAELAPKAIEAARQRSLEDDQAALQKFITIIEDATGLQLEPVQDSNQPHNDNL